MLNRVVLIGRPVKDPELRYTPTGTAITQFILAVDRPFTNSEGEREADFIPVQTWRGLAETVASFLKKGKLVAVEGRIQVRHYDNSEGKRVYVTEIVADNVRFLDKKESTEAGKQNRQESRERGRQSERDQDPFHDDGKPIDISDDDLPF